MAVSGVFTNLHNSLVGPSGIRTTLSPGENNSLRIGGQKPQTTIFSTIRNAANPPSADLYLKAIRNAVKYSPTLRTDAGGGGPRQPIIKEFPVASFPPEKAANNIVKFARAKGLTGTSPQKTNENRHAEYLDFMRKVINNPLSLEKSADINNFHQVPENADIAILYFDVKKSASQIETQEKQLVFMNTIRDLNARAVDLATKKGIPPDYSSFWFMGDGFQGLVSSEVLQELIPVIANKFEELKALGIDARFLVAPTDENTRIASIKQPDGSLRVTLEFNEKRLKTEEDLYDALRYLTPEERNLIESQKIDLNTLAETKLREAHELRVARNSFRRRLEGPDTSESAKGKDLMNSPVQLAKNLLRRILNKTDADYSSSRKIPSYSSEFEARPSMTEAELTELMGGMGIPLLEKATQARFNELHFAMPDGQVATGLLFALRPDFKGNHAEVYKKILKLIGEIYGDEKTRFERIKNVIPKGMDLTSSPWEVVNVRYLLVGTEAQSKKLAEALETLGNLNFGIQNQAYLQALKVVDTAKGNMFEVGTLIWSRTAILLKEMMKANATTPVTENVGSIALRRMEKFGVGLSQIINKISSNVSTINLPITGQNPLNKFAS